MLVRIIQLAMALASLSVCGGHIVLKNGKEIKCDGPYEIKGKMLQYNSGGTLFQLPLKIVDLSKSSKDKTLEEDQTTEVLSVEKAKRPEPKRKELDVYNMVDHDVITAHRGDTTINDKILTRPAVPENNCEDCQFESFLDACENGAVKFVKKWIEEGKPIYGPDFLEMEQPIIVASQNANPKIVKMLIDAGAPLDTFSKNGFTPLFISMIQINYKKKPKYLEIFNMIMEGDIFPDLRAKDGSTPLEYALNKRKHFAKALLEKGADPNLILKDGDYLIFRVIRADRQSMMDVLLNYGVDIEKVGPDGHTPLIEAVTLGRTQLAFTLLDNKANYFVKNKKGQNCLEIALESLNAEMAKLLLLEIPSYKLDKLDERLVYSVTGGADQMVSLLLENGANPNTKSEKGDPVLVIAAKRGHLEIVEMLLNQGANPNIKGQEGLSAAVLAMGKDKKEIQEAIRKKIKNGI